MLLGDLHHKAQVAVDQLFTGDIVSGLGTLNEFELLFFGDDGVTTGFFVK
jgi:hypothetical protein